MPLTIHYAQMQPTRVLSNRNENNYSTTKWMHSPQFNCIKRQRQTHQPAASYGGSALFRQAANEGIDILSKQENKSWHRAKWSLVWLTRNDSLPLKGLDLNLPLRGLGSHQGCRHKGRICFFYDQWQSTWVSVKFHKNEYWTWNITTFWLSLSFKNKT